jgi:hypothetical protein
MGILLTGAIGMLAVVVLSTTLVFLASRRWPGLTASYSALVQLKPNSRAVSLAVVRGAACGLLILGLYAVSLRLGVTGNLTWPRLQGYWTELNSTLPSLNLLGEVIGMAGATAYLLAFFLSFARRWTSSPAVLTISGGALWIATMSTQRFESLPPDGFLILLTFVVAVAFSWMLVAFDVLTLLVAAFTFHLWLHGYGLTRVFELVGNWEFWLPFAFWGALLVWGLYAGFRPLWERVGRRLAAVFE